MRSLSALIFGFIFGIGLVISGMTLPANIQGFLNITGSWKPALMFVMVGAIGVHLAFVRIILRNKQPLLDSKFYISNFKQIDKNLLMGSAIFGVGWGLGGFCPGPVFVAAGTGNIDALIFIFFMFAGMFLAQKIKMKNAGVLTDTENG